jgi:5-formyltetrahydrofolate cyclo-ligase
MGPDERVPQQDKPQLRAELLAARRARRPADLTRARAAVREHVLERTDGVARVAAYEPMRTEPGSIELLAALHARGMTVLVPVTLPDRDLDWTPWAPAGAGAPLGVDAIRRVDLVLAPALAVARDGSRLGRGGGSYDRALARCATGTMLATLVFDDEVLDALPHDEWDVPVQAAVTPSGWLALGGNTEMRFPR